MSFKKEYEPLFELYDLNGKPVKQGTYKESLEKIK